MRIDLNQGRQLSIEDDCGTAGTAKALKSPANLPAGEDQFDPPASDAQIQALAARATQLPDVRQERVQSLRQAIQSGLYHFSPEQMARAMFEHMISETAA